MSTEHKFQKIDITQVSPWCVQKRFEKVVTKRIVKHIVLWRLTERELELEHETKRLHEEQVRLLQDILFGPHE